MKRFILMLQFTTRLPIPIQLDIKEEDFGRGTVFFPLVGLIIGVISFGLFYFFDFIGSKLLAVLMLILGEIIVTGGLHYDGLGDTFDALYSGKTREGMLEVMKDSRLGTHGVLAIILNILLKIALYTSIRGKLMYVIVCVPIFSRLMIVYGGAFSKPARKQGLGNLFISYITIKEAVIATIMALIPSFYFLKWISFFFIMLSFAVSLGVASFFKNKIGGMTGDTLGALNEIGQIIMLFGFLIYYNLF